MSDEERRHGRSMDPAGSLVASLRKKMSASQFRRYSEHMTNATQSERRAADALHRTKEKMARQRCEQPRMVLTERGYRQECKVRKQAGLMPAPTHTPSLHKSSNLPCSSLMWRILKCTTSPNFTGLALDLLPFIN